MRTVFIVLGILLMAFPALAQTPTRARVVASCGTPNGTYPAGSVQDLTMDVTGLLCNGGTISGSVTIGGSLPAGSNLIGKVGIDQTTPGTTNAVTTTPGTLTLVPLDVATVTTGGTAVTALTAGHRNKGGWLQNPPSATINLCINEIGAASGTTSAGNTTCVAPGGTYQIAPSGNAVSAISSDSAHPFSGMGFN